MNQNLNKMKTFFCVILFLKDGVGKGVACRIVL